MSKNPTSDTLSRESNNGKTKYEMSGNTVKFKTKQMGRGGEVTLAWTGMVSGDEIKFTRQQEGGQGMPQEFTAKRAK